MILKAENLSVGYSSKRKDQLVASNMSFNLNKGELIGLVGTNGIGKSTLLRTLTQLQPALKGSIEIKGKSLDSYSPLEFAGIMSVVLTEHMMSKNLSVKELVALGRQPYTNWIGRLTEVDYKMIEEALVKTDCLDYADEKCFEISDGQLQKAMIARALAQDTDLIMLDEPTTHLDMYHKAAILKLLRDLAHNTKKTILFSSHEIDLAIQLCDKMIVMKKTEVVCDSPCRLIEKGVFHDLFPEDVIDFDPKIGRFKIIK